MGEVDDVCNVCALAKITKTPVPRVAVTQAEEKLEKVFTDVRGPFRVEPLSGSGSALCLQTSTQSLCSWTLFPFSQWSEITT